MPVRNAHSTEALDRVVIVGTSGAGKTTFGARMAEILDVPHIELDALFWGPSWTPVERRQFESKVRQAVGGERWLVDGNYSRIRHLIWSRATHIIWLDYSFPRLMLQLIIRTMRRVVRGQLLFSGNRESIGRALFSRESILLWGLSSYGRHRREFTALITSNQYPGLEYVVLKNPRQSGAFLEYVQQEIDRDPDRD